MADLEGSISEELLRELDETTCAVSRLRREQLTLAFEGEDERLEQETLFAGWRVVEQASWRGEFDLYMAR